MHWQNEIHHLTFCAQKVTKSLRTFRWFSDSLTTRGEQSSPLGIPLPTSPFGQYKAAPSGKACWSVFHAGNKKMPFNIKIVRHLSYPILFFDVFSSWICSFCFFFNHFCFFNNLFTYPLFLSHLLCFFFMCF